VKRAPRDSDRILVERMLEEERFVREILRRGYPTYSSLTEAGEGLRARLRVSAIQFLESGTELGKSRFADANPGIPWGDISEKRQKIVHAYSRFSSDEVWALAKGEMLGVIRDLRKARFPSGPMDDPLRRE